MKSAITLVLISSVLLFLPTLLIEQFDQVKAWALMIFAFCSIGLVKWRYILTDQVASILALFTVSALVSTIYSIDPHMSFYGNWHAPMGFMVIFSYLVFYLAARAEKFGDKDMYFIIGTACVTSIYACLQAFGIDFMKWSGTLSMAGFTRPPSTIGHPNFTAGYLVMVLPFVMYRIEHGKTIERALMFLASILMLSTILFCQSRGMWIAAGVTIAVYFIWSGRSKGAVISSAFALGLIISILMVVGPMGFRESAMDRMAHVLEPGQARHEYPTAAIRIWKKYPILGAGTDAFETAFQHQRTPHYWQIEKGGSPHRAHFDLLNILATQGIVGFVIAIMLLIVAYGRLLNSSNPARAAIAACLAAFFIEGLSSFVVLPTGTLAIFCLAVL